MPRAALFALCLLATNAVAAPLWQLGTPDGSCVEFGLADASWPDYAARYPRPITVNLATQDASAWPYIHPSTNDTWAGGRPHTFTLRFDQAEAPAGDLWLHLGYLACWEPSLITIVLNGQTLFADRFPGLGDSTLAYTPTLPAEPTNRAIAVPAGVVQAGANELTITLDNGSWIIYDYLRLDTDAAAPAWQSAAEGLLDDALAGPLADVDWIVFAERKPVPEHWYANFAYYAPDANRKLWLPGGRLSRYNLHTGAREVLIDDPEGGIRDPAVSYDGKRVLFSWRRGTAEHFNLWELSVASGDLRQITFGDWDDIEPTYLPDGGLTFVSSRCQRWVNCWLTPVAVIYRCDADGGNMRPLSANIEHDNTPWPMADGRLVYTRWEYIDRSQVHYHHLWTMGPDGTEQAVLFGNERPGDVYIDTKPVAGSDSLVTIVSPGHGDTEHNGRVALLSLKGGPDHYRSLRVLTYGANFRDPWAFDENTIIAARGPEMVLISGHGSIVPLHVLPEEERDAGYWLHEPRPLVARPRERVVPQRPDLTQANGRFFVQDVHLGRNMTGVGRGEITDLLVLEALPKPVNFTGGMEPMSYGGTFTLERVLGTVPVDPDGSAYFEAPALRSLIFVALDKDKRAVKRMQSFATVQPGETLGCVGCHEPRTAAPSPRQGELPTAVRRAPATITPITGQPDVLDYPRDIQPIWDKHCVSCHNPQQRDGGVNLSGHRGPMFTLSYFALTARDQLADGRNRPVSNYPPRALGSGSARLLDKLLPSHYDVQVDPVEAERVRLWIDVGAPHPGTYTALGTGMIGGYAQNVLDRSDMEWPATQAGGKVLAENCGSCHQGATALPSSASDEIHQPPWEDMSPTDPRRKFARHLLYDLTVPVESTLLLAPLARDAGGFEACGRAVFASTDDPDYLALLGLVQAAADRLNEIKRFDMPGFQPRSAWYREMRRYGLLPDGPDDPRVDFRALEEEYWRSLWWTPLPAL